MKVVVFTDLHFGIYRDLSLIDKQIDTLKRILLEEDPDILVVCGDVFHLRNSYTETILKTLDFFKGACATYIVRGNHDTVNKVGSTRSLIEVLESGDHVRVINEVETLPVGGRWFSFVPHYEDPKELDLAVYKAKSGSPDFFFGHFGYHGALQHPGCSDEANVKLSELLDQEDLIASFLGHIHKPNDCGNVHIIGTQYSCSFGEANQTKRYAVIEDDKYTFKPIDFGIRHILGDYEFVKEEVKKYKNTHSILARVVLESAAKIFERDIKEDILNDGALICDIRIMASNYAPNSVSLSAPVFHINESVIDEYVETNAPTFNLDKVKLKKIFRDISNED